MNLARQKGMIRLLQLDKNTTGFKKTDSNHSTGTRPKKQKKTKHDVHVQTQTYDMDSKPKHIKQHL